MAQQHADFTCSEWKQDESTNYITEPIADAVFQENRNTHPCPEGTFKTEYGCKELLTNDDAYYGSEEHSDMSKHDSYNNEASMYNEPRH